MSVFVTWKIRCKNVILLILVLFHYSTLKHVLRGYNICLFILYTQDTVKEITKKKELWFDLISRYFNLNYLWNCVTLDTFHIYYSNNGKTKKKEFKYLFICQLFFQLNRKFYLSLCDVDSFCFHFFFFLVIICICYDTTLLATQHIYIRNPHTYAL